MLSIINDILGIIIGIISIIITIIIDIVMRGIYIQDYLVKLNLLCCLSKFLKKSNIILLSNFSLLRTLIFLFNYMSKY